MRNYCFTSVWVSVSGSGADSVLCSLFGILYFHLGIYLSVSGFGFSILLVCFFLGFCTSISRFWVFVLYYGHQRKLSVFFLNCMILFCILWFWFLCFRFGICVSVLGFGFSFWVLWYVFSLSATIYLFDRRLSVNLSTRGNLTRLSISWQFR